MVFEIAQIEIVAGKAEEFEAGVSQAIPLFMRARGCNGVKLHRTIEHSGRYLLVVEWTTVEDHMVHFRASSDFQEWRRLVGPFFQTAPVVVHTELAVHSGQFI
ncbi:antibiotic biosynthesis monooxygenase [Paraburkholderia sp. BL25I1N1]|uniref:antibiotic biosynthesis monooxygenase family protein n=1 Tax=Paraburkholderia sp. BL25I1N1 TaxID=1938804 RepID=UPI000D056962|nr:antibiotic biosynthesis monooxygenase family protein [Paraburkholderia sp. BL25I1N1]PRY04420.1 quinol monooxygenase YgiN [Paraburkholderia sp. BL25I1N1]